MPLSSDTERLTPVMAALWASSAARSSERYSRWARFQSRSRPRRPRPDSLLSFSMTKHRYNSFFLHSARKAEEARRPRSAGRKCLLQGFHDLAGFRVNQRASLGRLLGIKAHAAAVLLHLLGQAVNEDLLLAGERAVNGKLCLRVCNAAGVAGLFQRKGGSRPYCSFCPY